MLVAEVGGLTPFPRAGAVYVWRVASPPTAPCAHIGEGMPPQPSPPSFTTSVGAWCGAAAL